MGHKNYTKYSENSEQVINTEVEIKEAEVVNVTPVDEVLEDEQVVEGVNIVTTQEETEQVVNTEVEIKEAEVVEEKPEQTHVDGVVINCSKLNVRKEPNKESDAIGVLNNGVFVIVELENSTEDFYKVRTAGVQGYCMKNYISIE